MNKPHKASYRQLLLQLGSVLLLLALLLTILITETVRAASIVLRERVQTETFTVTDSLSGYLFRDETALRSNNNGPVRYFVSDADSVSAGTTVAAVYLDDTDSDKREQAAALTEKIRQCDLALSQSETAWQADYLDSYATLMRSLSADDPAAALSPAKSLAEALARRDATSDEVRTALLEKREQLLDEWMELVAYVDAPQTVPTTQDGVFYQSTDGFEALFGTDTASGLTPEGLEALLSAPIEAEDVIGKLVSVGRWFFAVPVEADLAATYEVGRSYTVHFEANKIQTELLLSAISYSADEARALLLLRGDAMPEGLSPTRRQHVTVEKESVTGLSIPASALLEGNTVYLDQNGIAKAHTVTPLLIRDGCVLLPEDSMIRPGARVLISTRRVYDGKVLN